MTVAEVIAAVMRQRKFKDRVKAICVQKAYAVLDAGTPANQVTWAKGVVSSSGYDATTEGYLILAETTPASVDAAVSATDNAYSNALNTVLPEVILAKDIT